MGHICENCKYFKGTYMGFVTCMTESGFYVRSRPSSLKNCLEFISMEENSMKTFTKKNLRNGDVAVLRNGKVGIVIPDQNVIVLDAGDFERMCNYADDLRIADYDYPEGDIMKVYRPNQPYQCRFRPDSYTEGTLIYERKEIEEMTLEEICSALGKEIKIVKEK